VVICMKLKYLNLLILLVLPGCTTTVTVEGSVPTPLVEKMPARVGVYYSPDFKSFRHEESIAQRGSYQIDFGKQNLTFFRNLMSAMFESVVEVPEPPLSASQMQGLDGVVVPEVVKYGFLPPAISGLNFYSASIHYRITLYDSHGKKVRDWTMVGYGKSEGGLFGGEEALGDATLLAIRDGGARLAIDFPKDPAVLAWLKSEHEVNHPSEEGGVQ